MEYWGLGRGAKSTEEFLMHHLKKDPYTALNAIFKTANLR
jgi:hypothetical protein